MNIGYRIPLNENKIHQSGHGIALEVYYFPFAKDENSIDVGIFGGWTWKDRLWNNKFNKSFVNDYQNNLIRENFSGLDSLGVSRLSNEIKDYQGREIPLPSYHNGIHERNFYAGFQIKLKSLYHVKLNLYVGTRKAVAGIDYDSLCLSPGSTNSLTSEYGYFYFKRPIYFGGDLSFNPFAKNTWMKKFHGENIFISFFYEWSDFTKSKFKYWSGCEGTEYISFTKILPADIIKKYRNDVRFGIKFGIRIK